MTLEQAERHLGDIDQDDRGLLQAKIREARAWCESVTHRALVSTQYVLTMDAFPWTDDGLIELPKGRCLSVDGISYKDTSGNTQQLTGPDNSPAGTDWEQDLSSDWAGRIRPPTFAWPSAGDYLGAVSITFTAGFGTDSDDVPEDLQTAVLFKLADLWEMRGLVDVPGVNVGAGVGPNLEAAKALAMPWAIRQWHG